MTRYQQAKQMYAEYGVDTEAAIARLSNIPVSIHCWQGDDVIGFDGADEVVVAMLDAEGNELATRRSIAEKAEHTLTFEPDASGEYTFAATLSREGEEAKTCEGKAAFVLPLGVPAITSATSDRTNTCFSVSSKITSRLSFPK